MTSAGREPLTKIRSPTVVLAIDNIDTDQIIPARYLKVTTKSGLGEHLFADWRRDRDGRPKEDFVLNQESAAAARILVAGDNFGCGSSREHAPWAIRDFGFRAVISSSIADIFKNNAVKNGLVPVEVDSRAHRYLLEHPGITVTIDLEACRLDLPELGSVDFPLDAFSRLCLLRGIDPLDYLMEQLPAISSYEASLVDEPT